MRVGATKKVGVFFTLTNRALYPVIYMLRGCQSSTRSTGQENIRKSSTGQSFNESMKTKTKQKTREQ